MKASLPFKYIISAKNGKQYVVFDFKDINGKRKRKWVGTNLPEKCTKKALNAKVEEIVSKFYEEYCTGNLTKAEPEKVDKTVLNVSSLTNAKDQKGNSFEFTEFMHYWLDTITPTISYNTLFGYKQCLKKINGYFNEVYPHLLLTDLTALQLQQFYNDKYNSGLTGNTIKHYHANIHKALKYAVKMDLLNSNPADKVELPKIEKFKANFYNKEELDKLFEAFKGDRLELVVNIAAYYGLRRSEVLGLKWDVIDFDNKTIKICRKITSQHGVGTGHEEIRVEDELKTEASVRTLPLIPHIEKMLKQRRFLEIHYSKLLKSEFDRTYDGFVCRDNYGKLITPNFVSQHFRIVIENHNLKLLRFHDLRHSCASLLLANGVSMKAIQEWLGHSTFNVMANFYSHLDYNSKIASAETIAKALGGVTEEQLLTDNEDIKNRKSS